MGTLTHKNNLKLHLFSVPGYESEHPVTPPPPRDNVNTGWPTGFAGACNQRILSTDSYLQAMSQKKIAISSWKFVIIKVGVESRTDDEIFQCIPVNVGFLHGLFHLMPEG